MSYRNPILTRLFADVTATVARCSEHASTVEQIADAMIDCFEADGRVLICGNGGSCAQAAHLATELSVRFERERRALPAICLGAAASELTALGNDYAFEQTYQRLVMAHGKRGDCLIAITTSGNSANVLAALSEAKVSGLKTIALLGEGGGEAAGLADIELLAPGGTTARVQESHQIFIHAICALIDEHFSD